jgi:hypothetical protein
MTMAPMKKRAEKEGGEKITVEVKNGSASRATTTGYGGLV